MTKLKSSLCWCVCLFVLLNAAGLWAARPQYRPASEIEDDTIYWMKKVADWQLTQSSWNSSVSWERAALHAGLLACYEVTKDEKYLDKSRQFAQKFNWQLASASHHADNNAVGQVFVELYLLDQPDPARYAHFRNVSDSHIAVWPTFACDTAGGSETWWWCDALFMAPPGLVRLSRAANDPRYITFMHKMWLDTQNCLYDTQEHLFFRDISYFYPARKNCNGDKVFWSRGNGWVLAGIARLLQYLPCDDPGRPRYAVLLQEMAETLKTLQQPDGFWHSDLLGPNCYNNPETSGTGFFTFGIAWGINNGLLDPSVYWPTVEAGWEALKTAVQPSGLLGWVQPVGADPRATTATTTDVFGVGAYLLAGSEVYKYLLAQDPNSIELFESYADDASVRKVWLDGDRNGTAAHAALGDYGDNFMLLAYENNKPPYYAQTDCVFAAAKDFTATGTDYLSVLCRGLASNAPEVVYVRLEDLTGAAAVSVMPDTAAVQTPVWLELAFRLSDFAGVDLTQVKQLSIGLGEPGRTSPAGSGVIRIDTLRLAGRRCAAAEGDFNGDCTIDMEDFAVLAEQWQDEYALVIDPVEPDAENLLAFWSLDGDYNDSSGRGCHAVPAGNPVFINPGHIGQSVYFDGASYLNCQNSADMTLHQGGTVSAWIKSSGLTNPWASVVTKGIQSWRLIRNNTSSAISFHFNWSGGEYQANGSTPVLDNQWHHLLAVYDGSSLRLYVDGQLDAAAAAPAAVNSRTDPVYIGSRVDKPASRSWTGQIDEVRIYDKALNQENLLWLAEKGPLVQISEARPADLMPDGVIDIQDLRIFALSWMERAVWP